MTIFQPGDQVERIGVSWRGVEAGGRYIIASCSDHGLYVYLEGHGLEKFYGPAFCLYQRKKGFGAFIRKVENG